MLIIAATWYDDTNTPFMNEYFGDHLNEEKIFDFYEYQKSIYGREVIASYPNTRVFSDGTRVILELCEVKQKVENSIYEANGVVSVDAEPAYKQLGEAS